MEKLALTTNPHPKPYTLKWINNDGGIVVKEQVNVPIFIGSYEENVICDVIPIDIGHIIIGSPWQYDHKYIHDGYTNKISFTEQGSKIILIPLTLQQVRDDDIKLKVTLKKDKNERNKC